jgi:oxygen-independent coproporphyrinogen-3 oxidase
MSAISQLYNCYAQNVKNVDEYISLINAGRYATEKGYILSREEMIIGEVISNLMCNDRLEWAEVAAHFDCTADNIKEVTGFSPDRMKDFVEDGLLEISEAGLKVTETGRFIIRNIAAELDPNLNKNKKQFSKSI